VETPRLAALQDQRAERILGPEQGTMRAARKPASMAASRRGLLGRLVRWKLQHLTPGNRLAQAAFSGQDVKLAERFNDLLVWASCFLLSWRGRPGRSRS
jgi:hypothetical protein